MESAGWVHLDLKPVNLIMGVPPRIVDRSIARTVERAVRTRGILGTDRHMAPEQRGTPEWEGRLGLPADVFGLGRRSGARPPSRRHRRGDRREGRTGRRR
jgi:eukaryotic-like serine/threonine-protein kinase